MKKKSETTIGEDLSEGLSNLLAPLVLLDTMKNSVVAGKNPAKILKKSLENYPASVYENAIEGEDILKQYAPEFVENNPTTATAAGLAYDLIDPLTLIPGLAAAKKAGKAGQALSKVPNFRSLVQKQGQKSLDKKVRKWVRANIASKDFDNADNVAAFIKKAKLEGKLKDPESLGKILKGTEGQVGTRTMLGEEVKNVLDQAVALGAKDTDRRKIVNNLVAKSRQNALNPNVSNPRDPRKLRESLQDIVRPYAKKKEVIASLPPKLPTTMPAIPTKELDDQINEVAQKITQSKELQKVQKTQKVSREQAQKAIDELNEKELKSFNMMKKDILDTQNKELQDIIKKATRENQSIAARNAQIDKELADLAKAKSVKAPKEVLDTFKVSPTADAATKAEMEIYNRRAKQSYEDYIKAKTTPKPKIKEEELLAKKQPLIEPRIEPVIDDLDALPPPVPRTVDAPPPIPDEVVGSTDDLLKQLEQLTQTRKAAEGSNAKIVAENARKVREASVGPTTQIVESQVPVTSSVKDLWELRKSIRNELSDLEKQSALTGKVTNKVRDRREAIYAIEKEINSNLEQITLPNGQNALDLYGKLKNDYGAQEDLIKIVEGAEIAAARKNSNVVGNVLQSTGAALGIGASGGNMASTLGYGAGRAAGQAANSGMIGIRAAKALTEEVPSQIAAQAGLQTLENVGEGLMTERQQDPTLRAEEDDIPFVDEVMGAPQAGRSPQSVQEEEPFMDEVVNFGQTVPEPVEMKMDKTLNPQPVVYDPYVNDEILNTPLPRNTERLIANPQVLKAKLSQAAPQHLPVLEDMMQNDPEGLRKAGPMIAMMVPSIFERDEYDAFDGKIVNPMMQQKFMVDLKRDESLGAIEKANLALKVRRGEPI